MKTRCRQLQIWVLWLAMLPAAAQAQFTYITNNGDITITGYFGSGRAVIIPAMTNGLPVTSIGSQAFLNRNTVTNVTIPGSVTNLGYEAFNGCSGLTGIYFQGNAPSLGLPIFSGDYIATIYYLPGTSGWSPSYGGGPYVVMLNPPNPAGSLQVTLSPATIANSAQWQVDGGVAQPSGATVTGLSVGNHTVSFSLVNGWIQPASQSIVVSANSTATAGGAYGQFTCTTNNGAITITGYTGPASNVVFPGAINGLTVASIGTNALLDCTILTNVTIPGSITNLADGAFYGCSNLTKIYFQGNVPSLGSAVFGSDTNLTVYYLPGTSGWSSTFGGRPAMMLNPPNPAGSLQVTISPAAAITNGAQWQVDGGVAQSSGATVTGLSVGSHTVSFSPVNGWAMPASQTVTVSANSTATASGAYAQLTYLTYNGANVISKCNGNGGAVVLPSTINGLPVVGILADAFQFCNVTSVTIPGSITNISIEAFKYCDLIAILVDPTNAYYSSTNGVLFNKAQTTLVEYPYGLGGIYTIPQSVTNIAMEAFGWCTYLTGVVIGTNVSSIANGAFFYSGLTSITIPNNVTSIGGGAFANCFSLTSVTIGTNVTSIGGGAFNECPVASVLIPASVTSIGGGAFDLCGSLIAITVDPANLFYSSMNGVLFSKDQTTLIQYPGGLAGSYTVPQSVTNIEGSAFANCSFLTSVTMGTNVTSIGDGAFYNCSGLTSATISASVAYLGNLVFGQCGGLSGVYFPGNAPGTNGLICDENNPVIYYLPWTTGWPAPGTPFGGLTTALWLPQAQTGDGSFGVQANQFGFNITWASDTTVMVDACTDLANPVWTPVSTNTLTGGSSYFSDPDWVNYPGRFYRIRSP